MGGCIRGGHPTTIPYDGYERTDSIPVGRIFSIEALLIESSLSRMLLCIAGGFYTPCIVACHRTGLVWT